MSKMNSNQKTCFVISPIGDSGSEIRKSADDLFDLIVTPALKPYDFKVIRADKLIGTNIITNDIINLVQNSELCIIDLTSSNPNVFYECGRRHETGKPFIQVIRAKEKLPFDVSGIRTIEYDLSNVRQAQETVSSIQLYIEDLIKTGLSSTSSGFSLSNIASTLERIERKIENMGNTASTANFPPLTTSFDDPVERLKISADPFEGLKKATETGDLRLAEMSLQTLFNSNRDPHDYIKWCVIFAGYGDQIAFDILKKLLENESFNYTTLTEFDIYVSHFYTAFSKFQEYETGYNLLIPKLIKFIDENPETDSNTRYLCYDVIALFSSGIKKYEESVKYAEKALVINPADEKVMGDLIYYYGKLDLWDKSYEISKKYLELYKHDIKSYMTFESIIINFYTAGNKKEGAELLAAYKNKFPTMYNSFIPILDKVRNK